MFKQPESGKNRKDGYKHQGNDQNKPTIVIPWGGMPETIILNGYNKNKLNQNNGMQEYR